MSEKYSGVVVLNKPAGITSHDAVNKLRKIFNTRKVGHTGTLDPMATGVLPILVGNAVKASSFLVSDSKSYRTRMILGIETDTQDISGNVICKKEPCLEASQVETAIMSFLGEGFQIPPMYSALKVNGKKLCDLARNGIEIEREARPVFIEKIWNVERVSEAEWEFSVSVSKGTYIRTLVSDIGKKIGCGGTMSALQRIKSGNFELSASYTLEELQQLAEEDILEKAVISTESLFTELDEVYLSSFYTRLIKNGQPIYSRRAKIALPPLGCRVKLFSDEEKFFGLGEIIEIDGEKCVKSIKLFVDTSEKI